MVQAPPTGLRCRTVLLFLLAALVEGENTDKAGKAVNDICQEARYVRLLAEKLQQRLSNALSNQEAPTKAPTAYRIAAAATTDDVKRTAFTALAIVADREAAAAIEHIKAATPTYQQAINLLKQQESRLTTLARYSPAKATFENSNDVGQTDAAKASAKKFGGQVKLEPDATLNCSFATPAGDDIKLENVNIDEVKALKMTDESKLAERTATITAYCKGTEGNANTASTVTKGFCSENAAVISSQSHIIGATLTVAGVTPPVTETDIHAQAMRGHTGK
uniref:Variant surface glycoprotein 1125.1567 n=1 Tax=Trypanosoma brucei TaxID=5691 RepID=A0A1J0R7B2_9TRYP|nr:variant surface glycoprotein 1125.1567 [Trypanosoma brucei]